jgi:enoyl-CoA hydratase
VTTDVVLVEDAGDGVTVVTLNRPERLNAMSRELVDGLHDVLDGLREDRDCRAVVLTGAGRGFCAGLDLKGFGATPEVEGRSRATQGMYVQEKIASLMPKLAELPQPVVAAVNGPATGGGLALALASDTRICTPTARFNAAFVKIGLSGCDVGVSWLLPRLVGPTLAFDMLLSGRLVEPEEALRTGLVLRVVPDGEVVEEALRVARSYAANTPFGVRMTKQVAWTNLSAPTLRTAIELENRTQILTSTTEDHREALTAFVEKRPATFRDR